MSKTSTSKRSVLDERFLKCGECNERFWDNSKLIKHMESHAETKMLLCTICNKTFTVVQDLDKHYLLHRQLMQPYGCPACESRFVTQQQLMSHVDKIHPELTIGDKTEDKSKSPETAASRRNSPRKKQINIEKVKSIRDNLWKVAAQPVKGKSKSSNDKEDPSNDSPQSTAKMLVVKTVKSSSLPEKGECKSPKIDESPSDSAKFPAKKSILTIVKSLTQSSKVAEELSNDSKKSAVKKSILKVAPKPSAKKRPVIWKDPVVSPEKDLRRNIISVQYKQSSGEKRKLVSAHLDSSGAKKLKIVPFVTAGESAAPVKFATPLRKTPIAKTKLMQSISDLYDNKAANEKKSMAQTRKDLLNALTITPVTKGPIRVLKNVKPFIIYSPSNDVNPIRSSVAANVFNRTIVHKSVTPRGNVVQFNVGKQNVKAVGETSQDFDKLLTSTKTSPSVIKATDMQVSFDTLTKKPIPRSNISAIQLIPIPQLKIPQQSPKSELTIQATPTGITKNTKSGKIVKNVIQCAVVSPSGNTKLPQSIFPACKIPQGLKIIRQSPLKPIQSSLSNKISPAVNLTEASNVRLMKSPKLTTIGKLPTKEVVEPESATQLISEREIHRDPGVKSQKLQILLPSITLKRFSGAELEEANVESLVKTVNNNVIEASKIQSDKESNINEQVNIKLGVARGIKRRDKVQSTEDNSVDNLAKLKCTLARSVKKTDFVEEPSTSKRTNANDVKTRNKLPPTEGTRVKEQAKLKIAETSGDKIRGKLQIAGINDSKYTKELSPIVSNVEEQAHLQSVAESPKSPTKNATCSKPEPTKENFANKAVEETNNVISRRSNRCRPQVPKTEVTSPTVLATRRSKRTLVKVTDKKSSLKGLKKTIKQRKEVLTKTKVKKNILKKVIEKEVTAIESVENKTDEDLGVANKTENVPLPAALRQTPVQNKIRIVTLTPEVMKKLKDTVLKKTSSTTPNHIRLVVPSEVLCRIQNSAAKGQTTESPGTTATKSENSSLSNLKVSEVPAPMTIIRYGLEDLKRDQQRRREEKEKMVEKEKILKKMLVKFDEKEKKKQIKFCEKKLTRFLGKHRESHLEKLEEKLLNVRNLTLEDGIQLLEDVKRLGCRKCKEVIGRTLCSLGFGNEKYLFCADKAVEGLITLSTSKAKKRRNSKKANVVSCPPEDLVKKKRPYNKRSQSVTDNQQSPKKLAKVSPKKEPVSPKKEPVSPKKDLVSPKKESPSKPGKSGFSIIECAPNKGGVSYSNVDGKKCRNLKRKAVPLKAKPVKTKVRRNLQRKPKQSKALIDDPFVDVSIITEEKFVIKCPCMKPNCNGLHPENFLI